MKTFLSLGLIGFVAASAHAQTDADRDRPLGEDIVKVSEHVWQIVGWPNIGIVVGEKATLVVNTGLGPRKGATVARVAKRLAPDNKLYLTTTHFHPEHAGGVAECRTDFRKALQTNWFRRSSPHLFGAIVWTSS